MNIIDIETLFLTAVKAAINAGKKILEVYFSDSYGIELKDDESPITKADKNANAEITMILEKTGLPILSEEGKEIFYEKRKKWEYFWLVDPLDGTKEFIKRNGEFTVNIALIHKSEPIAGIVFLPTLNQLYFASNSFGSYKYHGDINQLFLNLNINFLFKNSLKLPLKIQRDKLVIVGSSSHSNEETETLIKKIKQKFPRLEFLKKGSSLKFCVTAEGLADIYLRSAPTMEWDTAAGHVIAKNAGLKLYVLNNMTELSYNRKNLLNPGFVLVNDKYHNEILQLLSK